MNIEFMCELLANYSKELSEAATYREKGNVQLKHAKIILHKVKNCSIPDVVKSLPNDDEIERAANEEANRIFDDTGSGSEWYARHHGFVDGVEWLKNHLSK